MLHSIIWLSDLSERADLCRRPVMELARLNEADPARVILAHAAAPTDEAVVRLDELAANLVKEGIPATVRVRPGKPLDVARELADEHEADLVVAGASGVSGVDRVLLGSTARQLVRGLDDPTLIVGAQPFDRLERILCAVDVSDRRESRAIRFAHALSMASAASVEYVSVVDGVALTTHKALYDRIKGLIGLPIDGSWKCEAIRGDDPAAVLVDRGASFDLVVMRTAKRTRLNRLLHASVAENVVEHSRVPVLISR